MILKLNNTYQIVTDNKNVILQERKIAISGENVGKEYFSNLGYYSNFEQAIKGCLKHGITSSDVEGLQAITNYLACIATDIITSVKLLEFEVTQ